VPGNKDQKPAEIFIMLFYGVVFWSHPPQNLSVISHTSFLNVDLQPLLALYPFGLRRVAKGQHI
jgi:hypothetical protein